MITPVTHNLVAYRWQPFIYTIGIQGYDFTLATFAMDWRVTRDVAGSPLVALRNAAPEEQGISCTSDTIDDVLWSFVRLHVPKATLNDLLLGASGAGRDVVAYQDLHITGGGLPESRFIQGTVTIQAGSTQL